jgi:uncharacterized protein
MQRIDNLLHYSASDLVAFLECEHRTALDLWAVDDSALAAKRIEPDEAAQLVAAKGDEHERRYLQALRAEGVQVVDIAEGGGSLDDRVARTLQAMKGGAQVIFQAALREGPWMGHADFLRRVDEPSDLGDWSYEVSDTKLARSPKAKFLVQLAYYSQLVAKVQGRPPARMYVVLGNGEQPAFRVADYAHYLVTVQRRFLQTTGAPEGGSREVPYPVPCDHCSLCHWKARCEEKRLRDDHLSQVAGITSIQTAKLEKAGIGTMAKLADAPADTKVPRMVAATFTKLRSQAQLQDQARRTGERAVESLPLDPLGRRGWFRLPAPDPGDMYFDMEGDPLQDSGLEYLFGVGYWEQGQWNFLPFWAHNREEERLAFEAFMDFVCERRKRYPGAHVYHYASYEQTALKRLAPLHATREVELDDMLRNQVLVDLYKVVRESIRISEPSYSIKYVEHFYRATRAGEVQNAGASIVFYERWLETGERQYLDDIEAYNGDDVESTRQLHDWLRGLRPQGLPWKPAGGVISADQAREDSTSERVRAVEAMLADYRQRLVDPLPHDRAQWTARHRLHELTYQLLDFHRRAAKPQWWAVFSRMEDSEEELLDDAECLAGLTADPQEQPSLVGRSRVYTYIAPEQETKLSTGDVCRRCDNGEGVGAIQFDEVTRRVRIKIGQNKPAPPPVLSIGPQGPIDSTVIADAIRRFADSLLSGQGTYPAAQQFLTRERPRLRGREAGSSIVEDEKELVEASIQAAKLLDNSCLYVQGPPGAGKTYTGSRMIAALLAEGHRVGVMSNSHKAINHLMAGALRATREAGIQVRAVKKATSGNQETELQEEGLVVHNVYRNDDVWADQECNLIGGTAWLFCDPAADRALDYLFVDEAGQVALANLVAAGTCARNIVLLGDQMQLGQPVQGVHPGRSGDSALDYLLDGAATIAPDRGIFLATTWRLHPDICSFISDAVYDGRLVPEKENVNRRLVLGPGARPELKPAGIVHVPIIHEGCSQTSLEEAQLVRELYKSALTQHYTDKAGRQHPISAQDILVVAPYNAQVNLLRRNLPADARVGTVDKFQGQEAALVIVSMTTSSEQDLPRHIEFLYSRNRLNVAVSRAMCLAVVISNPALTAIGCRTPEQMALVNTLCWLAEVGELAPA